MYVTLLPGGSRLILQLRARLVAGDRHWFHPWGENRHSCAGQELAGTVRTLHAFGVLRSSTVWWPRMTDSSLENERILLVEDDPEVSRAVARSLRREGLEVTAAPSCSTARALTCCFEMGVFDIGLGDGDGVELAQQLLEQGRVVRAVFFTSAGSVEIHRRARRVGPVVRKTDGAEALVQLVLGMLGRRATTQSGILPVADKPQGKRDAG